MTIDYANRLVRQWARAMQLAEPNAGVMCRNPTTRQADDCAIRMDALDAAETRLLNVLADMPELLQPLLPAPLTEFLSASADQACPRCRYSSSGPSHAECAGKSHRYFAAREKLEAYGLKLYGPTNIPR